MAHFKPFQFFESTFKICDQEISAFILDYLREIGIFLNETHDWSFIKIKGEILLIKWKSVQSQRKRVNLPDWNATPHFVFLLNPDLFYNIFVSAFPNWHNLENSARSILRQPGLFWPFRGPRESQSQAHRFTDARKAVGCLLCDDSFSSLCENKWSVTEAEPRS